MSILSQIAAEKYPPTAFSAFTPAAGFSLGNASAMAWVSQLTYEATDLHNPNAIVAGVAEKWGLQARVFAHAFSSKLPVSSARGIIAVGPTAIMVAFTGTEPLSPHDYLVDFEVGLSLDDVHDGYERAVDGAWADIGPAITANSAQGKALFFAGHSMGGALAVIAAARAVKEKVNVTAVYTIGGARAGGEVFAAAYPLGDATFRLVYGDDMVTAFPPLSLGYRHVGRMLFCPRGKTFPEVSLSPAGEDDRQLDRTLLTGFGDLLHSVQGVTRNYPLRRPPIADLFRLLPPGIADHVPDTYLNALGQTS
jgi:triacylglycerol lipase